MALTNKQTSKQMEKMNSEEISSILAKDIEEMTSSFLTLKVHHFFKIMDSLPDSPIVEEIKKQFSLIFYIYSLKLSMHNKDSFNEFLDYTEAEFIKVYRTFLDSKEKMIPNDI